MSIWTLAKIAIGTTIIGGVVVVISKLSNFLGDFDPVKVITDASADVVDSIFNPKVPGSPGDYECTWLDVLTQTCATKQFVYSLAPEETAYIRDAPQDWLNITPDEWDAIEAERLLVEGRLQ